MIDDEGDTSGSSRSVGSGRVDQTARRVATPRRGSPGVRPRARGSCPTIPPAPGRGDPRRSSRPTPERGREEMGRAP